MKTIEKIRFSKGRIFIETEEGKVFSRPLEAFPILKNATEAELLNFKIGKFKDDIRWENLDEDIHISSFFSDEEPKSNPIGDFFSMHPQINVSSFAKQIGINKSLMAKYIYGIKTPSEKRKKEIQEGLHNLAKQLSCVEFA
ncbi:MAG: DUF2442 domain-containing protein [Flavobacteriaceae bacterium]|jgi:hypothetical protein|nr:DUF2442 domain-containing protein [Flavobacteriaceae bacterium]